jgi:hypothetical protein
MELAQGERGVARFIGSGHFALNGRNGAIGLNGIEILAEHSTGHIKALVSEVLHLIKSCPVKGGRFGAASLNLILRQMERTNCDNAQYF